MWLLAPFGYWGQTPISLRRIAPHPAGEPKARRIWALTPKTKGRGVRVGPKMKRIQTQQSLQTLQRKVSASSGAQPDTSHNPTFPSDQRDTGAGPKMPQ